MKISEYLQKAYKDDPVFARWIRNQWLSWIPPKRKISIFADASLPRGFIADLIKFGKFKLVGNAETKDDLWIYQQARRLKALLLTRDKDFWNDKFFPLAQSLGVIIIEGNDQKEVEYAFIAFIVNFGIIDAMRKIPNYPMRMKFRVSCNGFIVKFLSYDSKITTEYLEY